MLGRLLPAVTLAAAMLIVASPAFANRPAMPAADGKPMLWPTATTTSEVTERGPLEVTRHGFVDAGGSLVIPPRYSSYSYCGDADGRPLAVLATDGHGSDLLDLTGEIVGHVDAQYAECAGADYLIVAQQVSGRWGMGVVEAATGDEVLEPSGRVKVEAISPGLVNVSRPGGEYFLELATGVRTTHPGWVTVAAQEPGAPAIPAATKRSPAGKPNGKLGYVDRTGAWLIAPELDAASQFRSGYAVIEQNGRQTFLDVGLRRVGGEWDRIRAVTVPTAVGEQVVGYWVEAGGRRGLLGPDLQTVVQAGPGQIDCQPGAGGACAVVAPDGSADMVRLPGGGATPLPPGFDRVLTAGLVGDGATSETRTSRIRSVDTGRAVTLPGQASCQGAGELFVVCPGSLVVDADGDRSEFSDVIAVPDVSGGVAYYWVTSDREQGFLDSAGRWRYRLATPGR
ncbi:MAG: WG repeat-containing protein [Actinobacteria bacterium]|nr:WG repeat-containing protein [Actinomycetota bacterium]